MRIAAKRLRYVLEVTAEPCFGPVRAHRGQAHQGASGPARRDPRLRRPAAARRGPRRRRCATPTPTSCAAAPASADDLDPALAARLPHAGVWRGLVALETYLRARRTLLYEPLPDALARPPARGLARAARVRDRRAPGGRAAGAPRSARSPRSDDAARADAGGPRRRPRIPSRRRRRGRSRGRSPRNAGSAQTHDRHLRRQRRSPPRSPFGPPRTSLDLADPDALVQPRGLVGRLQRPRAPARRGRVRAAARARSSSRRSTRRTSTSSS